MQTISGVTDNPLFQPFLTALLDYREAVRRRVEMLTDDELVQVYDLFAPDNAHRLPIEFWNASFTVRGRIRFEQRRRAALTAISPVESNA